MAPYIVTQDDPFCEACGSTGHIQDVGLCVACQGSGRIGRFVDEGGRVADYILFDQVRERDDELLRGLNAANERLRDLESRALNLEDRMTQLEGRLEAHLTARIHASSGLDAATAELNP